jgi:Helix-turn-helix domain
MTEREPLSERPVELTDPRAMRALAHPVRMALLGLLRTHGPMTATQAGARLGESSGTCSFHFRQLEKYGFCEEAGGGKGREKPWRATAAFTTWGTAGADPERAEAEQQLSAAILQYWFGRISRWLADRHDDTPEWQQAAGFGDVTIPLTPAELEALREQVDALVRPYVPRMTGAEEAPAGSRRVALVHFEFPEPEERA